MNQRFYLNGRVVMVTGSVGNLGAAVAEALIEAGARAVLVDRSEDRLAKAYPKLAGSPGHLLLGGVNLNDQATISSAVEQTIGRFGAIDGLVNTVGTFRGGKPVYEEDLATWDHLFETNLRTTLLMCRAAVPRMLERGSGRIVNVASAAALHGAPGIAAYSAAKSALIRLTESLAAEVKTKGLNVNCILPGTIDTPQNRQAMPGADTSTWVEPAAIADAVLFLLSDAARAVQGASLPVLGRG